MMDYKEKIISYLANLKHAVDKADWVEVENLAYRIQTAAWEAKRQEEGW